MVTPSPAQPSKSDIRSLFDPTEFPSSWLSKRPKLPSRNWLIFFALTSSITGFYLYDRQHCKRIRREYIDRVRHLADQPMDPLDWPRKVTVYGAKWPGDEDHDRSMRYFRKYVKPIFVAAAIDFEMITGRRHGDLARRIASDIQSRRRISLGLDTPPVPLMPMPIATRKSPEETRKYELDGGIVIVGRPTFKEFMAGLNRGWTDGLESVDTDELLARELESDGRFNKLDEPDDVQLDGERPPPSYRLPSPKHTPVFSPLQTIHQSPPLAVRSTHPSPSVSPFMDVPPLVIPQLPPLLLVPFTNYIGFTQIPFMIWDFFNQRHKFRAGAEAAYKLIKNDTRPFQAPTNMHKHSSTDEPNLFYSDIDFDKKAESYYKNPFTSTPANIEKARKEYYDALPAKLETARAISRGNRERTKEEIAHPPPTGDELRAERMKKEKRWRADLEGWAIVNPDQEVVWDERFESLQVFVDSSLSDN